MAKALLLPDEKNVNALGGGDNGGNPGAPMGGGGGGTALTIIPRPPEVLYGEPQPYTPYINPKAPLDDGPTPIIQPPNQPQCAFAGGCGGYKPVTDTAVPVVVPGGNPVLKGEGDIPTTVTTDLPSWARQKFLGVELWLWLVILAVVVILRGNK